MIKLSLNIPTYNRDSYLRENLNGIISQLRNKKLESIVEINISDNASTDKTRDICAEIKNNNSDIDITYQRNEANLGPDLNFIAAMQMARGEYSILFGDDDFFEPDAISRILEIIKKDSSIDFILSNRISIDAFGNEIKRKPFLKEDVDTEVFDFSNRNNVRAYFSLVNDLGAVFTFISSVVYKTNIIEEVGVFDSRCIGSNYSFLNYWWRSLLTGKKVLYNNEYLIKATIDGATNNNYGRGLKRLLVDTDGLSKIANYSIEDKGYRRDFLAAVRRSIPMETIYRAYFGNIKQAKETLFVSMEACGWSPVEIKQWKTILSLRQSFYACMHYLIPNFLIGFATLKKHL